MSRESDRGFARMRWKRAFQNQQRYLEQLWFKYLTKAVQDKKFYQFDLWIEKEFKLNKHFGKRDRQWYSECLFSGLRYARLALELWKRKQEKLEFTSYQSSYELAAALLTIEPEFFWKAVEQRVFLEEEVDSHLRKQILEFQKEKSLESLLLFQGLDPNWKAYIEKRRLRSSWNTKQLEEFLLLLSQRALLWIRIYNQESITAVLDEFQRVKVEITEKDKLAFSILSPIKINQLESFLYGKFEVQDWASQQILSLCNISPEAQVWDACAGGGGKSIQISSKLKTGMLYISDIRDHKLKKTMERLKKVSFNRFQSFVWSGESVSHEGSFDLIIVDAPCSSSGVLRRNPELRLKIFPSDILEFKSLQLKLLQSASKSLKVGGYLLYGTCSFFVEENEEVVEMFLEKNTSFVLEKMKLHGSPEKNSDTTFSALLKKVKENY